MRSDGRLAAAAERFRTSLFLLPMLYVAGGIVLALAGIALDDAVAWDGSDLPLGVGSTVGSARAVLTTVAGATITVAGIAFSIALLILQMASSQHSPRIVHGLFRDAFNKRVMGVVLGTFTYCLVVLRAVHDGVEGGRAVVPTISTSVGVVLGVVAIAAIVAFIDHNAKATDVSNLLSVTLEQATEQVEATWPDPTRTAGRDGAGIAGEVDDTPLDQPTLVVRFDGDGWIRRLDVDAILASLPAGATFRCERAAGDYATGGQALGVVWPAPAQGMEHLARALRRAVGVGRARTIQHDPEYGVRQLVDVALRALSPGINDPTTAQDAIFRVGTLVQAMLERTPPPQVVHGDDGRRVLLPARPDHVSVVRLAFDEIRRDAATRPKVCCDLLAALERLLGAAPPGSPGAEAIVHEARLTVEGCRRAGHLDEDLEVVEAAYERLLRRSVAPVVLP
jgi:uncharacterized membrane protein